MRHKEKDQAKAQVEETSFASSAPVATSPGTPRRLAPLDIQQKEFRVSRLGGYKMRDVDEFLDQITDAMSAVMTENERLRRAGGAGSPVVGTADLADVNRQADEIIQRARDEAGRITAEAREQAASLSATGAIAAAGGASAADRAAINAFLAREKEFLQSLAGLVQGHAETVKSMAKTARTPPATPVAEPRAAAPRTAEPTDASTSTPPVPAAPAAPAAAPELAPDSTSDATMSLPRAEEEAPVRVEEPEPAAVGRGESEPETERGDDSLRELFWGED